MDLIKFMEQMKDSLGIPADEIGYFVGEDNEPWVRVTKSCPFCEDRSSLDVRVEQHLRWKGGEFVQDVWPEWSRGRREWLISGCCERCFDEEMGELG